MQDKKARRKKAIGEIGERERLESQKFYVGLEALRAPLVVVFRFCSLDFAAGRGLYFGRGVFACLLLASSLAPALFSMLFIPYFSVSHPTPLRGLVDTNRFLESLIEST